MKNWNKWNCEISAWKPAQIARGQRPTSLSRFLVSPSSAEDLLEMNWSTIHVMLQKLVDLIWLFLGESHAYFSKRISLTIFFLYVQTSDSFAKVFKMSAVTVSSCIFTSVTPPQHQRQVYFCPQARFSFFLSGWFQSWNQRPAPTKQNIIFFCLVKGFWKQINLHSKLHARLPPIISDVCWVQKGPNF